eukprot:COSAG02_NODE_343_length_24147_cov_30.662051_11_plen_224_part_00
MVTERWRDDCGARRRARGGGVCTWGGAQRHSRYSMHDFRGRVSFCLLHGDRRNCGHWVREGLSECGRCDSGRYMRLGVPNVHWFSSARRLSLTFCGTDWGGEYSNFPIISPKVRNPHGPARNTVISHRQMRLRSLLSCRPSNGPEIPLVFVVLRTMISEIISEISRAEESHRLAQDSRDAQPIQNTRNFNSNPRKNAATRGSHGGALYFSVVFPYSKRFQPSL